MTREEAIERIKYCIEKQAWALDENDTEALYEVIPELRESEDERIRKEIIELLKEVGRDDTGISENAKCMIAWLEKQKEQKPEWSEEDGICLQDALWCVKQASKIARGENDMGACWSAERWLKSLKNRGNSPKISSKSPSWKPSEEQMEYLQQAIEEAESERLYGLRDGLINLMEALKEL